MPLRKKLRIKSLSWYLLASAITSIVGLVINPFLAIGLSHEDYAIIGYFSSFGIMLSPIVAFSFNSFYARNYFLYDEEKRQRLLQTLLSLFIYFGGFMFMMFFVVYYLYHKQFVNSIPFSPYALLSFLPVYFSSFYNIYLLDLRLQDKARHYFILVVVNALFAAVSSLVLVYFLRYGAVGRLSALLLVSIVFAFYFFKTKKFRLGLDFHLAKEAFLFCWPLTISAFLAFFFTGIDRSFLAQLNDNFNLGLYNVGLQISAYLGIFGTVLLQTFDPNLYKYTSLNQHYKVTKIAVAIILLASIPNLLFIVISKPLIAVLTANRYTDATVYANILCIRNIATTFAFIMSGVIIGYGLPKVELINRVIGAILSIFLYKILIKSYGYYGAAWGQTFSWVIMGCISLCFLIVTMRNKIKEAL
jgi:O-antigen/teichoic acid export membrane protein